MKYLILGSAGLIGSALASYLKNQGHDVIGLDIENGLGEDLRIANNDLLDKAVKECDYAFFLAFDVGGSKYLAQYEKTYDFIDNNMRIMLNVFESFKTYNTPFLFATSQMSQMTHSTYGSLKLIGEHATNVLNGRNVSFWNAYGYEKPGEKSHVIADFVHQAVTGNTISMQTTGVEQRQFLHVDDCSEALYQLSCQHEHITKEEKLHITGFEWTSIMEIAQQIAANFDNCKIVPGNRIDNVQHSIMNQPDENILKYWQPVIDLDKGIKRTIKCYLEKY